MFALDTNVLVRLLVADDAAQARRAESLIAAEQLAGRPVLLSLLVLLETEWVLRSRYELPKERIADALSALLDTEALLIEDEEALARALHRWRRQTCGLADCLIAERHLSLAADATLTFDRQAAKRAGMQLVSG